MRIAMCEKMVLVMAKVLWLCIVTTGWLATQQAALVDTVA